MILLILLFGVGIAEVFFIIKISAALGVFRTIAYLIIKAMLGAFFARLEAFAVIRVIKLQLERNEDMVDAVLELLYVILGAILMLIPGVICTCIGILFIVRPTRLYFVTRTNPGIRQRVTNIVAEKKREFLAKQSHRKSA